MTPELLNKSGKFALFRRRSNHCRLLSNKKVFNYGHRRQKHPLNRNLKIAENFSRRHVNNFCQVQFIKFPALFRPQKYWILTLTFRKQWVDFSALNEVYFPWKRRTYIYRNGPSFTKGRMSVNPVNISFEIFMVTRPICFQTSLHIELKKSYIHEGKKDNKLYKVSSVRG